MKKLIALSSITFLFNIIGKAQFTIRGKVTDEEHRPLVSVSVKAGKQSLKTITDSLGNYSFQSSTDDLSLTFSCIGYETSMVSIKGEFVRAVTLIRSDYFLSEAVVNSFERNTIAKNLPASVTVLSKDALERYGIHSFVPAMNTVTGVKMDERSPGSYRIGIRGNLLRSAFGVRNVKVYWNGIPFTDANGNTYFNELSLNHISKIEILKGPSGSMYGSGTGGVILLTGNLLKQNEKNISFQASAGSYGTFSSAVSFNQGGKQSANSVSYSHQQSDGYRDHTKMRRDVANYKGNYFIDEHQKINANIFYSDLYYQTPGGLNAAESSIDPKQARPAAGSFRSAEAQQAAIFVKTLYAGLSNEYQFNRHWLNTTALYFSNTFFTNPAIRNYERKTEQGIGLRTITKYRSNLFTATFGTEYQYGFTNTATFGNRFGEIDTLQIHDEINSRQFNIFFQGDFNLMKNLVINAGMSYNNFHFGFLRVSQVPSEKISSNFKPQFVPRVSVLKNIRDQFSIYGSVSYGYSPPSIDEVHATDGNFNSGLNAEKGMNYEVGIKGDILKNKLSMEAAYYWFSLEDAIVSRKDAAGADYFVNAGNTKQRGLETSVDYLPVNNINLFFRQVRFTVNYTNNHARFVHYSQGTVNVDGNKLTGTSPNVITINADLKTTIGLYMNLSYFYTDQIPLNDANTFFAGAYHLLFGKLGYKINLGRKITSDLYLGFNKCFNNPYSLGNDLNAAGNRFFNTSSPRDLSGGLNMKFTL